MSFIHGAVGSESGRAMLTQPSVAARWTSGGTVLSAASSTLPSCRGATAVEPVAPLDALRPTAITVAAPAPPSRMDRRVRRFGVFEDFTSGLQAFLEWW